MCPEPELTATEDLVTDRELADRTANCFDLSRQFAVENSLPGPADAEDEAGLHGCGHPTDSPSWRGFDKDLVFFG